MSIDRSPGSRPGFIVRHLMRASGVAALGALFFVAVLGITLVVSRYTTVEASGWALGVGIPPWYMLGMGVYMTAVYLPLYIAHGLTRRQFIVQVTAFVPLLAAVGAFVVTVGFGIERAVYAVADWPHEPVEDHRGLFTSLDQYGLIFLSFWLVFSVFLVTGGFLGAAFYRQAWGGLGALLMVPVALVLAGMTEFAVRRNSFPLGDMVEGESATAVSVLVVLVAFLVGLALTWAFVRDLPMRSKAA